MRAGFTNAFINGPVVAAPVTYSAHLFFSNPFAPSTAGLSTPTILKDAAISHVEVDFCWDHPSNPAMWAHKEAGGSFVLGQYATSLSGATLYGMGVTYDGTTLKVFLNGVVDASYAAGALAVGFSPAVWIFSDLNLDGFSGGTAGEVCWWRTALTDHEMLALGKGVRPILVHPKDIISYFPLVRDPQEYFGQTTNEFNTSYQPHCRMFYQKGRNVRKTSTTHAYTFTSSGGIAIGGGATAAAAYVFAGSGGIAIGGTSRVFSDATFSTTTLFTSAGEGPPGFQTTTNFASAFTNVDNFVLQATQVLFSHKFVGDSGELANGRYRR